MTPPISLASRAVTASLSTTAAMLIDAAFDVDGAIRRPFARAPWVGHEEMPALPGHLRVLAAEFVGVPFGSAGAPEHLGPDWMGLIPAVAPAPPHGPSADDDWEIIGQGSDWVTLALDYPDAHDILRIERTVRLRGDSPAIDFELVVTARRPARTSIGLHPILRLPQLPGALTLEVPFEQGFSYPGTVPPGAGRSRAGCTFDRLDRVPAESGGTVDFSRLPFAENTEDVLLLGGVTGPVLARFRDDGTVVRLNWDHAVIPSALLWVSDSALQESPWNGRYRGLGIEPIAAAFDFDNAVSVRPNPISRAGYPTSVHLDPDAPLRLHYSIEVGSHEL